MEDIHDIIGPIAYKPLWLKALPWALGALALATVAHFVYHYFKKKKEEAAKQTPLTPYQTALFELKAASAFIGEGKERKLAIALVGIVRHYLEAEYTLSYSKQTSEEFLISFSKESYLNPESLRQLSHFINQCDLAKFAKKEFNINDQQKLLDYTKSFIDSMHNLKLVKRVGDAVRIS